MTTGQLQNRRSATSARHALSKVPEVTLVFWVTKILTTGMGETTSDFFNHKFDPKIAVIVSGLVLAASLWLQFRATRYSAWIYWGAVVMVSVFGTMCADVLHVGLGIPYAVSTPFFAVCLIAIFVFWYKVEGTLSIHSIRTPRRELFYWLTVVTTFALGTATGDLTATTLKLGYFSSGVMFAVVFAVPAIAYKFGLNSIVAFWFAYIVTRPFGASFADWMGVAHSRGGLDWGTGKVSIALAAMIVALVGYLAVSRIDVGDSGDAGDEA
jgi:uncharacterized membrane-anchored protein